MASNFPNSQGNCDSQRDKENKTCSLSDEETKLLIEWFGEYQPELRRAGRNSAVYRKIAKEINANTHAEIPKTEKDVQHKLYNIKKQYQYQKKTHGGTGSSPSKWPFYEALHKIYNSMPMNSLSLRRDSEVTVTQDSMVDVDGEGISVCALSELSGNQRVICTVSPEDVSFLDNCNFDNSLSPGRVSIQDGIVEMAKNVTSTPKAKKRRISGNSVSIEREKLEVFKELANKRLQCVAMKEERKKQKLELDRMKVENERKKLEIEQQKASDEALFKSKLLNHANNVSNNCSQM